MASATSSLPSLNSASAHFFGSINTNINQTRSRSQSVTVQFRPVRISAACSSTAERTRPHLAASPASSFYEVLGIQMGASYQEIKTAYRRLARVLHPDVSTAANDYGGENGNRGFEFMKVNEAYETLSDPRKRADYDLSLYGRGRRVSSPFPMSGFANTMASGYTGRKWESDQCW